jgi:hypothetical protein
MKLNEKLPRKCECGGKMQYVLDFGRIWSACLKCTPVVEIKVSGRKGGAA